MNPEYGMFVISLDFELYWGVRDKYSMSQYQENLQGVEAATRRMLSKFYDYGTHATWATVGFLFFHDFDSLKNGLPSTLPEYADSSLSPYKYIEKGNPGKAVYHFAPKLIQHIASQSGQEIATHTLSHYYCLEDGSDVDSFHEDIATAIKLAESCGISVKSLVFPRNQFKDEYLGTLSELGIRCFRGNQKGWLFKAVKEEKQYLIKRAFRLLDAYFNISGYHTYSINDCCHGSPNNILASRYLRPYTKKLAILDRLRINRITRAMTYAAENNKIFHLWWHPHDFGKNINENLFILEEILKHYNRLNERYGMRSLNMGELSDYINRQKMISTVGFG